MERVPGLRCDSTPADRWIEVTGWSTEARRQAGTIEAPLTHTMSNGLEWQIILAGHHYLIWDQGGVWTLQVLVWLDEAGYWIDVTATCSVARWLAAYGIALLDADGKRVDVPDTEED